MRKGLWRACFSFHRHIWRHDNFATSPRKTKNDGDSQKNDGLFPKNDGLFPKKLPRFWDFVGDNWKNKGGQRNKVGENTTETRQNKKDSTTKTKRIPDKIGRKEGRFVPKNKDLRSKILMQTLHFRPKNLVKRIIYCNFVHYKWGFLAAAAIQKLSLLWKTRK